MSTAMKFPGESDSAHPEIFNSVPVTPRSAKDAQLSAEDLRLFFDQGFIVLENFLPVDDLEDAKRTIDNLVDDLASRLYEAGKIKDLYKESDFSSRLTKLEQDFQGASVILHKIGSVPESFRRIWTNERLLNVAEQILGTGNVGGHPVWNLRTKVPNVNASVVPWHQDAAYLDSTCYDVFQLTAWIPLVNSNFNNGCMQVVKNGHKTGRVARHTGCWENTWYLMLDEREMEQTLGCRMERDVVTCEVPLGGVLLLSNLLPHRSGRNASGEIRWSLDFRWQDVSRPNGFYGLKDCIQMRSEEAAAADLEAFRVDWGSFDAVNRHSRQDESCRKEVDGEEKEEEEQEAKGGKVKDEFDVTIAGPWMRQWPMVNRNRHTEALDAMKDPGAFRPQDLLVG